MSIREQWYNPTYLDKDGITWLTDTKRRETMYNLSITNTYDADNKEEVVDNIITDLEELLGELKMLRKKDKEKGER